MENKPYASPPAWLKNWERTKLVVFTDKDGDGLMEYKADNAFLKTSAGGNGFTRPDSANTNELYIDNDILVLATPEISRPSPFLIALLAAALATASDLLITVSGAVAHEIYYKLINPSASEGAPADQMDYCGSGLDRYRVFRYQSAGFHGAGGRPGLRSGRRVLLPTAGARHL